MAWPERIDFGQVRHFSLDNLYSNFERYQEDPDWFHKFHNESEWVLGYALPSFQRPVVWDDERMVKFVESAILGLNLGTYTFNSTMNLGLDVKDEQGNEIWPFDRWLIDGQQRLSALERYWNNWFPVFDLYWDEVPERQKFRFLATPFPAYETQIDNENALRDLYDRMNFGGVAHTNEQRATLKA